MLYLPEIFFMKKKARIKFNNEEKIVYITDKLYEQARLTENLSEMVAEESKFLNLDEKYKHTPILLLPEEVRNEIFKETELERVCDKNCFKLDRMLINVIKKNFDILNKDDVCILNTFNVSDEDENNGIFLDIEATDLGYEDWQILKNL